MTLLRNFVNVCLNISKVVRPIFIVAIEERNIFLLNFDISN